MKDHIRRHGCVCLILCPRNLGKGGPLFQAALRSFDLGFVVTRQSVQVAALQPIRTVLYRPSRHTMECVGLPSRVVIPGLSLLLDEKPYIGPARSLWICHNRTHRVRLVRYIDWVTTWHAITSICQRTVRGLYSTHTCGNEGHTQPQKEADTTQLSDLVQASHRAVFLILAVCSTERVATTTWEPVRGPCHLCACTDYSVGTVPPCR